MSRSQAQVNGANGAAVAFVDDGNPLRDASHQTLESDARKFAEQNNLSAELMVKAAFLVKYENELESIPDILSLEEIDAMTLDEREPERVQKKALYFTIVLNSIAASIQGWDQTGSNGANLLWPRQFGIPIDDCHIGCFNSPECGTNLLRVGFVNSTPYIIITLLGCWLSDPVNHVLGRRWTIFVAAIFSLLAPLGSAFTQNWGQLVACRALLGIGMGLKEVTVPILSAEIAPRQIRGALVMSWQLCTAIGILLGSAANIACLYMTKDPDMVWRLQLGSAFIPAVPLVCGVLFCPESPRWLVKKDHITDAFTSLKRLRKHEIQAARDLYYIYLCLYRDKTILQSEMTDMLRNFRELFGKHRLRTATIAASIVMAAQQLCGINFLAFYSSTIFASTGSDTGCGTNKSTNKAPYLILPDSVKKEDTIALGLSLGIAGVWLVFALPSISFIDKYGRQTLLLCTIPAMFLSLFIAGFCFKASSPRGPVATFLFIFAAFYSPGLGPIPFTYSAEVFPIRHREIGMGWAVAVNNLFGSVLALTFPYLYDRFTPIGAIEFFAGLNVAAFILIYLFVPETKQKTLEQLDHLFGKKKFTRKHIRHQIFEMAPWYYDTVLLRKDRQDERPDFSLVRDL